MLRGGLVRVDGLICRDAAMKVDPQRQVITLQGESVENRAFQYYMLHKPAGYM